jgi:uncharacterized protein
VSGHLYEVEIAHVRSEPVRHDVRHRSYQWFVDLDDLPRLPLGLRSLARFDARDHFGDPRQSIRANVDAYLAANGIDLHGGSVTMLANARSLGYVFNPLSLFWCHDVSGALVCVIAEVRNTYGGRHCYLLHTDDSGRAETEKVFYVSPFYPVDGYYRMSVPEPAERLALHITLHRPNQRPFTASVRGLRRPATLRTVLATALRRPFETWRVRALITKHGIALWRKGLAIVPRPVERSTPWTPSPAHPRPRTGWPAWLGGRSASSCRYGCGRGTAPRPARATDRCWSSGPATRCGTCCGHPGSWDWPVRTSPATSMSKAIWATVSGGCGSWPAHVRGPRPH